MTTVSAKYDHPSAHPSDDGVVRRPGRPKKDQVDSTELLLRAAESAFARQGFKATTIRDIARNAGVNHALIIHRFGSKEELWLAVMARLRSHLEPFIQELHFLGLSTDITERERMERAVHVLVGAVCGEPDCGLLLSQISAERGKAFDLLVEKLIRPFHDAFCPLLTQVMDAGLIRKQNIETLYFVMFNAAIASVSNRFVFNYFCESEMDLAMLSKEIVNSLIFNIIQPG